MIRVFFSCCFGLLFITGGSVVAGDLHSALDIDKDGYVTAHEAEVMPELIEQFAVLDANRDGKLDAAELSLFNG
ncbi:EF-hand domain-containing protein [Desulfogranum japonicum]|uniref:hypothetical protein n=1 Tax=Desulfogranum japonicum TaxID=231447 RepID=UPI0003FF194A|nr:hypothetical protein [Desulfogranum japonicum]